MQTNLGGSQDAFLAKLNSTGSSLIYSTFLGGGSNDAGFGIAVDKQGTAYVTGFTSSDDFISLNAQQAGNGGSGDAFITKISDSSAATLATVNGRVLTPDGRGLRNAIVSITDSQGVVRTARTSSFGFFSFDNVSTGGTYTIRVLSKNYRYAPQTVRVDGNLTLLDFVGLE